MMFVDVSMGWGCRGRWWWWWWRRWEGGEGEGEGAPHGLCRGVDFDTYASFRVHILRYRTRPWCTEPACTGTSAVGGEEDDAEERCFYTLAPPPCFAFFSRLSRPRAASRVRAGAGSLGGRDGEGAASVVGTGQGGRGRVGWVGTGLGATSTAGAVEVSSFAAFRGAQ
jgi:hypothetical protein